jgi:hypothetical protein
VVTTVSETASGHARSARTVVASTHTGRFLRGSGPPERVPYVDDGGEPLLLLPRRGVLSVGPASRAVLVVTGIDDVQAVLVGRLHGVGSRDEAAREALRQHARCLTSALGQGAVQPARLAVQEVVLLVDGHSHPVSELTYAAAAPDTFAVHGRDLAAHVGRDHADLLRRAVDSRVDGHVIAVAVRAVGPDHLELDVVSDTGAWVVSLPLSPPVAAAHDVCDRLLELGLGLA